MKANKAGIQIEGMVFSNEETGIVSHEEFLEAFAEMIESKGWVFAGATKQNKNE
ncbi:MAG: hypothetical protein ACE3JP_04845 [Ectobacillus sp.]